MQDFQKRVVAEKAQLDEKISKLEAFIRTDTFPGLPDEEQLDLNLQFQIMEDYSRVLERRIERFPSHH